MHRNLYEPDPGEIGASAEMGFHKETTWHIQTNILMYRYGVSYNVGFHKETT